MPQGEGKDWAERAAAEVLRAIIGDFKMGLAVPGYALDRIAAILRRHGVEQDHRAMRIELEARAIINAIDVGFGPHGSNEALRRLVGQLRVALSKEPKDAR